MLSSTVALAAFLAPPSRLHSHSQHQQLRRGAPSMGSTSDFKNGLTLEFENSVWKITDFLHVKPGKGPAFVRSTLKNLETGKTLDKTWKAGEKFNDAQVDKSKCQYSYEDGDDMVFMNMETYEEERVPRAQVDKADFIVPESDVVVLRWQGKPIDVQIEKSVILKARRPAPAPPGFRAARR